MRRLVGTIHLLDSKIDVEAIKVLNFDIIRDYENNYMDEVSVTCTFPLGTYIDIIHPHKENIEFTLEATLVTSTEKTEKNEAPMKARYLAKIVNTDNDRVHQAGHGVSQTDALDLNAFINVEIQLLEKAIFLLRNGESGCIARKSNLKDFLNTYLTHELSVLDVADDDKITGIDLIDPDNQEEYEQIVIPHGTRTLSIPEYLQNKLYGLYQNGICSYIQNKVWYIYPRNDFDGKIKGSRFITIFVIPPKTFPSIERSYIKDGEHYKILCTGRLNMANNVNPTQLNKGTGMRYSQSPTALTEPYPSRDSNKAILDKDMMNKDDIYSLPDKTKVVKYGLGGDRFTINPFRGQSRLSAFGTGVLTCLWENSYPIIIEPGTHARVHILGQDQTVLSFEGIVAKAQHSTYLHGNGLMHNTWITNTGLNILIKNDLQDKLTYTNKVKGGATMFIKGQGNNSAMSMSDVFGGNY